MNRTVINILLELVIAINMCICNYLATSGLNNHFTVGSNKTGNDLATSRPFFFGDFQTRLPKIGDFQTGTPKRPP